MIHRIHYIIILSRFDRRDNILASSLPDLTKLPKDDDFHCHVETFDREKEPWRGGKPPRYHNNKKY